MPRKILIIRFSSIGDIVLTTPVVRCVKQQLGAEVHFVTKENFRNIVLHNPNLDKVITFKSDISEVMESLQQENYDLVIDLHKNLRSLRLKRKLKAPSFSFDKLNLRKFLAVRFKMLSLLPDKHIVDRYFDGIAALGVTNDGKGLEYFTAPPDEIDTAELFFRGDRSARYIALVVGGSYHTKKIPINKLSEICAKSKLPIILLGGKEDHQIAEELKKQFPWVINTCGNFSVNQSASMIRQASWVITSDTGMMHIAAAYNKKIISVWGNTIPEFGMSPYKPQPENKILEVKNLPCRPCSKLGFAKCPRGHFKCMNEIQFDFVVKLK